MKVGDMVRYRGWSKQRGNEPLALVLEVQLADSEYHKRIRVMWMGETIPVQASVLSISGNRITTWVSPKHFEVINESR